MTIKEAILCLKGIKNYARDTFTEQTDWQTSLDMAIKALEQKPCEDAISRQAMLYGLGSIAKAKAKSDAQKSLMGRVMFFTEHLPSVKPQEPKQVELDKIRAEIEAEPYVSKMEVLEIIDKYKAESEDH